MKRKSIYLWVGVLTTVSIFLASANAAVDQKWAAKMQKLMAAFSDLAPYVYSSEKYLNPGNRGKIESALNDFANLSHNVNMNSKRKKFLTDPSLGFIAQRLEEDAKQALEAFKVGNHQYARYKIRAVTRNCFQCHSRMSDGPEFADVNLKINQSDFKNSELGDVFVATRQFDKALKAFMDVLEDEEYMRKHPIEVERATRKYLAVAVRVKRDPKLAKRIVDMALKAEAAPLYLKEDAKIWRKHIGEWELVHGKKLKNPLNVAQGLIDRAKSVQEYPVDNRADVLYLRASAILHEYLNENHGKADTTKALYLLGHCYEILKSIGQWSLHEVYFEACVRNHPKTKMARRCYNRFELSTFVGYSGSGGLNLPRSATNKLAELKKLAF